MKAILAALFAASPAWAEPPQIVTDIAPVHALVAQVTGEIATPALLLVQGSDPHDFQMRPSQARALAEADLLIWVGPELTPWLVRATEGAEFKGEAVALLHSDSTARLSFKDGQTDPHAWLDPANASAWLDVIATYLAEVDAANAATYTANAKTAQAALDTLDAELRAMLAPAQGQPLYTYHDAYAYFARAYGLTIAGSLAEGDAAAPGARHLAQLRDEMKTNRAACVFAEADQDPALIASLTQGTDIPTTTLDPNGTGLAPGPTLYTETLRAMAEAIVKCVAGG